MERALLQMEDRVEVFNSVKLFPFSDRRNHIMMTS